MSLSQEILNSFGSKPRRVIAKGDEIIYRVAGGPLSLVIGSFFTPLKVTRVSQAELNLNVVTWGNKCRYLATYRVNQGTTMWIGKVAHGSHDHANRNAEQIYIENPLFKVALIKDVEPLKQDLFVSSKTGNA